MRTLKITNDKGRDAEVHFVSHPIKSPYAYVDQSGQAVTNKKYVKSTSKQDLPRLLDQFGSLENIADQLISSDPEIDMEVTCLLYTSPSPRDQRGSRMPSSA